VQVDSQRLDDERTMSLAAEISRKISDELTFPGQVKVTVIRTFTAQEVAR
jgi:ribonucrease Y